MREGENRGVGQLQVSFSGKKSIKLNVGLLPTCRWKNEKIAPSSRLFFLYNALNLQTHYSGVTAHQRNRFGHKKCLCAIK